MPTRRLIGAAVLLASLLAAQSEEHAIDRSLKACLERAASPSAMSECTRRAAADWHVEAARLHDELSSVVEMDTRAALKTAHDAWVRYAKSAQDAIERLYARTRNPGSAIMAAEDILEIPRRRALDLQKYLELTKESRP